MISEVYLSMQAVEFQSHVGPDHILAVPADIARGLPHGQAVRVLILFREDETDQDGRNSLRSISERGTPRAMPSTINYQPDDLVLIEFPFTSGGGSKIRPALPVKCRYGTKLSQRE